MKIGFFVWNPFQIYQFDSIVRSCPGATYILEQRKNVDFERLFPSEFLEQVSAPIQFVDRNELSKMDGEYDAIVCQTAFGHMERFEKTKVVGMQYSMSKERHQYGPWRYLCDLNLVYGRYSYDRVSHYSPCAMVGNPRFDRWFENRLEQSKIDSVRSKLDPSKKTILYLPTWGELSSMTEFGDAVAALSQDYNVIAKVHHKTDSHEASRKMTLNQSGVQEIFGASDDLLVLLSVADLVLSDYSGAIFDAINVGKPVILLQRTPEALAFMGVEKFGLESIEYAQRHMIGPTLSSSAALAETVHSVFARHIDFSDKNNKLKQQCFSQEQGCGPTAAQIISDFVTTSSQRPYHQIYVRDILREYRNKEEEAKFKKIKVSKRIYNFSTRINAFLLYFVLKWGRIFSFPLRKILQIELNFIVKYLFKFRQNFYLSWVVKFLVKFVPSRNLVAMAQRFNSFNQQDHKIYLLELAAAKSKSIGLTPYIKSLVDFERRDELSKLVDKLLSSDIKNKMRYLQRISRINDYLGTRELEIKTTRKEVLLYITNELRTSKRKSNRKRMLKILIVNRWLDDAIYLSNLAEFSDNVREEVRNAELRTKNLMGKFYRLNKVANHNYMPDLCRDDYLCLFHGEITRVGDLPHDSTIVEFHLPLYFFAADVTDEEARERICTMLKLTMTAIEQSGAAIVPKHQFRGDCAIPDKYWKIRFSYHTTGNLPGWWHIKDSSFPCLFTIDSQGYSGWSSMASLLALPEEARVAPMNEVDRIWNGLRERFVFNNYSKYRQSSYSFNIPKGQYVFLPLQVVTDAVAKLASISTLELAGMLARILPERGFSLVIKRHPKCTSPEVSALISQLSLKPDIYVTDASIHEILPNASAVITVNSGVGLEALLHGKLVVTTGSSEYQVATRKVTCERELISQIDKIKYGPDLEYIKRFIFFYKQNILIPNNDYSSINARIQSLLK